jgi:AraC family transcriptional regulator of adaptative response / DNA-3-methyladenine glycosylase II
VRAVLGQQISLRGARTLAGRLASSYGEPLRRPIGAVTHAFPSAEALVHADPDRLAMPAARRRALLSLARALAGEELVLDAGADRADARRRLLALPGIGPWTAEYIAMRALRDPDAFLPSDLGVRHALERLGQDGRPGAAARLSERWRPYRAYALFHLWGSLQQPHAATRTSRVPGDIRPLAA